MYHIYMLATILPEIWIISYSEFWSSDGQTDRQTDSDAYEPTLHKYKCAQKSREQILLDSTTPILNSFIMGGTRVESKLDFNMYSL